jgi:hypothetical protein
MTPSTARAALVGVANYGQPGHNFTGATLTVATACCSFLGSLGEPLVVIGVSEHCALGFGIGYVLRESPSFLSLIGCSGIKSHPILPVSS